jgi:hypothetical protein
VGDNVDAVLERAGDVSWGVQGTSGSGNEMAGKMVTVGTTAVRALTAHAKGVVADDGDTMLQAGHGSQGEGAVARR